MIADYTEAIRIDAKYVTAYILRGELFIMREEYGKARRRLYPGDQHRFQGPRSIRPLCPNLGEVP